MSRLVVQMGHVGRPRYAGDLLSVGTAGEQDFTRRCGEAAMRLLHGRNGWTVSVINADPGYPQYTAMGGNPEYYRGDAFVAFHCDGSENTARDGASYGHQNTAGRDFAQATKAAYLRLTGRPASWLEPDNYTGNLAGYYGVSNAIKVGNPRAIIMECGFLTNPADRAMLLAPSGPDNAVRAVGMALGIVEEDIVLESDIAAIATATVGRVLETLINYRVAHPDGGMRSLYDSDWQLMANDMKTHTLLAAILAADQDDISEADVLARLDAAHEKLAADLLEAQTADRDAIIAAVRESVPDEIADQVVADLTARLAS